MNEVKSADFVISKKINDFLDELGLFIGETNFYDKKIPSLCLLLSAVI
jgi:hypothetical protein